MENDSIQKNKIYQEELFLDYLLHTKIASTTKVTNEFEIFDVEAFNRIKKIYRYDKQFNSEIVLEITEGKEDITYFESHPDSYFSICKVYYLNGNIKEKGLFINHTHACVGTWYNYDSSGKLTEEIDWDKPYKFTFDDVLAFCKKENIPIAKGMDFPSKMIVQEEKPRKVEYITHIDRGDWSDDYQGANYCWEIMYWNTFNYKKTLVHIDGQTGKVLSRK
jgi:hypothetical protein